MLNINVNATEIKTLLFNDFNLMMIEFNINYIKEGR